LREISTPILPRGSPTRLSILVDEASLGDEGSKLSSSVDDDETNNS